MNINLQTDYKTWPVIASALLSLAIIMIRISEGLLESIGWRIISVFMVLLMLKISYNYIFS